MEIKVLQTNDLESAVGGFRTRDPGLFWEYRFTFSPDEVETLQKKINISLECNREYARSELHDMGVPGSVNSHMYHYLYGLGLRKN